MFFLALEFQSLYLGLNNRFGIWIDADIFFAAESGLGRQEA